MEERGLVGLEARGTRRGGEVIGRITEVVTDEETGEVTHVIVETDDERYEAQLEVPISDVELDLEADFATFHADPSDDEPGDHLGDEETPQGYAPGRSFGAEDRAHEGQFVTTPQDPDEAQSPEELDRQAVEAGGFEDEESTSADSGYPRNDAYIDPDTGDEIEHYPDPAEDEGPRAAVEDILDGTELRVRDLVDGVVGLEGSIASREDLEEITSEIRGLDDVLDVDPTDVDVG